MKKFGRISLSWLLICVLLMAVFPVSGAQAKGNTRVVNVVYDDSGSMFDGDGTWCRAKYSMEVFSSMLTENDTMNVYLMSDFGSGSTQAGPKLVLKGKDGPAVNADKVHNMPSGGQGTPFEAVEKARNDLESTQADEKWLIVLTDGKMGRGQIEVNQEELNDYFGNKPDDIKVMFLSIGSEAVTISADESKNIFTAEAKTSSEILGNVMDICTRVFNRDRLKLDTSNMTFSFDVPMKELIVFAQGPDVSINGVKGSDGDAVSPSEPVAVQYSDMEQQLFGESAVVDKNLQGSIATFQHDFDAGDYTLDITGAETVEIYYTPNVEIAAYLVDSEGNVVTDPNELRAGEYTLQMGFVKGGTDEKVGESELLGDVTYEATVTNNGKNHEKKYQNGDTIVIEEGDLQIDAIASFLEYNSVSTTLSYQVYNNQQLEFTVVDNPTYSVSTEGLANGDAPIVVKATVKGEDISQEIWEQMTVPNVSANVGGEVEFDVQKGSEPGVYEIYVSLPDGTPGDGEYQDGELKIQYNSNIGKEVWVGECKDTIHFTDSRTWWERNGKTVMLMLPWIIGLLLLAALILWWLNLKCLPKRIIAAKTSFVIDGNPMGSSANIQPGKLKGKHAVLTVKSPACPIYPFANCGVSLNLEAVDKRKVKSSKRKAQVKGISATNISATNSVRIGAVMLNRDTETNKLIRPGSRNQTIDFAISSGAMIMISGEFLSPEGDTIPMTLTITLRFI